jgi:hypothetical protein
VSGDVPGCSVDSLVLACPDGSEGEVEGKAVRSVFNSVAVSGNLFLQNVRTADREQNTGDCDLAFLGLCGLFAPRCT